MKQGWTYKKLGEVCQVVTGSTPKTSIPEYWDGKYPWITPAELKGDVYINDTERHITDDAVAHTNLTLMPIGTVLLSSRAPIGKVAITKTEMYCNQGFKNLICSDDINNKYLFLWLKGQTDYLNSLGRGATFKEISKSIVENIKIPLPPLSIQQSIVAELDEINNLLSLKRKELETYDKLAQSLFYEMFGDPVTNEKGWEVKKLGEVCEKITDGTHKTPSYKESGVVFLSAKNVKNGYFNYDDCKYIGEDEFVELDKRCDPRKGDIVITKSGSIGDCAILNAPFNVAFFESLALLKLRREVESQYIKAFIRNKQVQSEYIYDKIKGIAIKHLHLTELKAMLIPLPPLPLQQQFAQRIEAIEAQKAQVKAAIEKLETLLAARMQYWFE